MSIFEDMVKLRRLMNDAFMRNDGYVSYPLINAYDKEGSLEIEALMPGFDKDKIDVNYENNVLTISGENTDKKKSDEKTKYLRTERDYGKFSRSLKIGVPIDPEHIDASYDKGILNIVLKKSEEAKPKKIQIK